ncbi:MAG: iron-containing alcohol dehydrogenase [Pseudomonadota bacterium]
MSTLQTFGAVEATFGVGRASGIEADCRELGISAPLVVGTASTERRHEDLLAKLRDLNGTLFLKAEPHSPVELIDEATDAFRNAGCDSVISIGGGSSISIGKALAVSDQAVFIALPTTYSGSEATAIYGRRIDGEKRTAVDERCRPSRVIYDPLLSQSLPPGLSFSSAANCMAHAVDALYAKDANEETASLARETLTILRNELPRIKMLPGDLEARERLLLAGYIGGTLVSMHGIALHHQLCHVIGGLYGTPHGDNNAAILPQAIAYNTGAVPGADALIADVFEGQYPAPAVFAFIRSLSGNTALSRFGLPADAAQRIAEKQLAHGGYNPRPLDYEALYACVERALAGVCPPAENGA